MQARWRLTRRSAACLDKLRASRRLLKMIVDAASRDFVNGVENPFALRSNTPITLAKAGGDGVSTGTQFPLRF